MTEHIHTESYAGPERRRYSKTLEQLEADIKQMFVDHEDRERGWLKEFKEEFMAAFPGEDLKKHHDYHEARDSAAKAEEEFWKAAKSEALKHGISGLFTVLKFVLIMFVLGVAYNFGLGPVVAKVLGVSQ